jgi:hypothetical protein
VAVVRERGSRARQPVAADAGAASISAVASAARRRVEARQLAPVRRSQFAPEVGAAEVARAHGGAARRARRAGRRLERGHARCSCSSSCAAAMTSLASERSSDLRGDAREALVLGEQARGLQRLERLARHARGLQLEPQRLRAPRHAGRQRAQRLEAALGVAIVERPFGHQQVRAIEHDRGAERATT